MAYENINAQSLINSLKSCKNSINYSSSEELCSSIMNDNVWACESKKNLHKQLKNLNSIYKELTSEIDDCLEIANKIASYKQLQQDVADLKSQYNTLNGKLYYEKEVEKSITDEKTGETTTTITKEKVKDTNVETKMNEINSLISEKESTMASLKNSIDSFY